MEIKKLTTDYMHSHYLNATLIN